MKRIFSIILTAAVVISFAACSQNKAQVETATPNDNVTASVTPATNQLDYATSEVKEGLPLTTIKWDRLAHDFGTINEGDIVTTTFILTNTGEHPLVINNAKGSCGCTVPKVDKDKPIAPGESTEIEVQFNSNNRTNKQSKTVQIYANVDPNPSTATITANVTPKVKDATGSASTDAHAGHNH